MTEFEINDILPIFEKNKGYLLAVDCFYGELLSGQLEIQQRIQDDKYKQELLVYLFLCLPDPKILLYFLKKVFWKGFKSSWKV